jgi:hypothetical protein
MSNISSIDDLLAGIGNTQQATTPEHKEKVKKQQEEKAPVEEVEDDNPSYDDSDDNADDKDDHDDDSDKSDDESDDKDEDSDEKADDSEDEDSSDSDIDEYGNKKERMSKGMKERLERKDKQYQREIEQRDRELQTLRQQLSNQGASKEVQQAVKDFKYDPNEEVSWEQQLSDFVKHTVTNLQQDEQRKAREVKEQTAHQEFVKKFQSGMERFTDFREVVGAQPMDDAMTLSLRGMSDPTAFIYAASKRNPQELKRISELPDPYARMVEMGKLEQRMRRGKTVTKAPRPLGRTKEDTTAKVKPKQKDTSGDDLLAKADAKRLNNVKNRHARNR